MAEADVALVGPGFALGRASVAAGPVGENGYIALVLTRPPRARAAPPSGRQFRRTHAWRTKSAIRSPAFAPQRNSSRAQ